MLYVLLPGGRISRMESGKIRKYVAKDLIDLTDEEARKYRHMVTSAPSQPSRIPVRRLRNTPDEDLTMRHVVEPVKKAKE